MTIKRQSLATLCATSLYLSACTTHTQAQANPLADMPPPDEVRFINQNDATSDCIGNPQTPLCAVETFMACFARNEVELCRKAGVHNSNMFLGPRQSASYSVLDHKVLTPNDITEELKNSDWWKVGYVDITIIKFSDTVQSRKDSQKYSYSVKPVGNEWQIASWAAWEMD